MKKYLLTIGIVGLTLLSFGQYRASAGIAVGENTTMFTVGAEREFNIISDKIHINPGVRGNFYTGENLDFITAPAEYTANDEDVDTLYSVGNSSFNFINAYVRLGYDITEKLAISFDIDLVGLTFGSVENTLLLGEGESSRNDNVTATLVTGASPTTINYLIMGDLDNGSLNSTLEGLRLLSNL